MLARLSAFVVWALVAATAVFWGLRMAVRAPAAPAHAVALGESAAVRGDLSRLLGAAPAAAAAPQAAAPEVSSRFKLVGVMAPKAGKQSQAPLHGVALIAVDGKPAKPFAVGARLDADMVLQSVSLRTASIGPASGAPMVKLEMPPLQPPSTGTLPVLGAPVPMLQAPSPALPALPVRPPPGPASMQREAGAQTQ
jgi:general secretion pathway protein C